MLFVCISNISIAQPKFVTDSIDAYINREMQRWQIPGLAIAIIKDGKVIISRGYGIKDISSTDKVDENTLFQIASNTKAFTGTALSLLHYNKQLNLDEKVNAYIPWFKLYDSLSGNLVTVRDLLCHRIGFQTFQGDFLNWGSTLSRKQIIEKMAHIKPVYPFRYKYGYCNAAFVNAGEIITYVTDTSWDNYLKHHFFNPLGLTRTNTSYEKMLNDKNACKPHTKNENGDLVTLNLANIDNMGASACINSSVADMSKWIILQLNNGMFNGKQILPKEVIAETRKSHMINTDVNSSLFGSKHFVNYGLGWQMYDYAGKRVIEHSGGSNGFVTKTEFIPEENFGVIVYTNSDANSLYDALCKQVIEAYLNLPYRNLSEIYYQNYNKNQLSKKEFLIQLNKDINSKYNLPLPLTAYTGKYTNSFYGNIEIKQTKSGLEIYFQNHPQNTGKLKFVKDNTFYCTYTDLTCGKELIYFTTENNRVKSVSVKVDDFIDYLRYEFLKD